ncbi:MAG: hypothetical protein HY595_04590 [Candidatus Omnitrophica bacterium]|nr:hypothetical protein [Candidatus Omnitrophota bacterium]
MRLALCGSGVVCATLLLELGIRLTWDQRQGVPGLVLGHPTRVELLAPNYRGYFAGQPLRTNNLGFRDNRDYELRKRPGVFRIVVLGDSVTFGHGCRFEETWPYLLEQSLARWRPEVAWQVWNLGVPGYDTTLELRTLQELGPSYQPDLVIVGFHENDVSAWGYHSKAAMPLWLYDLKWWLKRHFYLYTTLRFAYYRLKHQRVEKETSAAYEQQLLAKPAQVIAPYDLERMDLKHRDPHAPRPPSPSVPYEPDAAGMAACRLAVDGFKRLHREGRYPIVFFINIAPDRRGADDSFANGVHNAMNRVFLEWLSDPTPAVSAYDAFWTYHPSEVPDAGEHSLGPANVVKADVLFTFLRERLMTGPAKERAA